MELWEMRGMIGQMRSVTTDAMLGSLHLTLWIMGEAGSLLHKTDCTGARRQDERPLRGSCHKLGYTG